MRLSELLGRDVHDSSGGYVGTVADVVLVQDGPMLGPYAASLRLSGLIVVERHHLRLMGYERDVMPLGLRWLVRRLAGRVVHVPWEDVDTWDGPVVTLRTTGDRLSEHDPAVRRAGAAGR
jgi:hypothetical protein